MEKGSVQAGGKAQAPPARRAAQGVLMRTPLATHEARRTAAPRRRRLSADTSRRFVPSVRRLSHAATILLVLAMTARGEAQRTSTVGLPVTIEDLVLAGSELEAVPWEDRRAPIALRIVAAYPHGTDYRYDLEYYGLEPGEFDLRAFLQRKDGSSTEDLPPLSVEIQPLLEPGQVEPNPLPSRKAPFLGGYFFALVLGGVFWFLGLLAILLVGRKSKAAAAAERHRPASLADRLRPIVSDAIAGRLTQSQQAELERMLLAFWRKQLGLEGVSAAIAMATLREHEQAGCLLRQLEVWLHAPGEATNVDVAALLEPYRHLPPNALEAAPLARGSSA